MCILLAYRITSPSFTDQKMVHNLLKIRAIFASKSVFSGLEWETLSVSSGLTTTWFHSHGQQFDSRFRELIQSDVIRGSVFDWKWNIVDKVRPYVYWQLEFRKATNVSNTSCDSLQTSKMYNGQLEFQLGTLKTRSIRIIVGHSSMTSCSEPKFWGSNF